jgi:hypothetical protein
MMRSFVRLALVLATSLPGLARADFVVIEESGVITSIADPAGIVWDRIAVGTPFRTTFAYDTSLVGTGTVGTIVGYPLPHRPDNPDALRTYVGPNQVMGAYLLTQTSLTVQDHGLPDALSYTSTPEYWSAGLFHTENASTRLDLADPIGNPLVSTLIPPPSAFAVQNWRSALVTLTIPSDNPGLPPSVIVSTITTTTIDGATVPEPASLVLTGMGLVMALVLSRLRKKRPQLSLVRPAPVGLCGLCGMERWEGPAKES